MFKRNGEYVFRNVEPAGKATTANKVRLADPITLIIDSESMHSISKCVLFENVLEKEHGCRDVTKKYFRSLATILSGRSECWKLWEVIVGRNGAKLHYFDLSDPRNASRRLTSLACYIPWYEPVQIKILIPSQNKEPFLCKVSYDHEVKKNGSIYTLKLEYVLSGEQFVDQYSRQE